MRALDRLAPTPRLRIRRHEAGPKSTLIETVLVALLILNVGVLIVVAGRAVMG